MTRPRGYQAELRVGLLLLIAVAIFAWMSIQIGGFQLGERLQVRAVFDDAAGLVEDSAVKVAGVKVGSVASLRVEDGRAVVIVSLDPDARIRADVRAEIRARSLLGEKYVALTPKGADAPLLADGDEIQNTMPGVEIGKLITQFGPLLANIHPDDIARLVKNLGDITSEVGGDAPRLMKSLSALIAKIDAAADVLPEVKDQFPQLVTDLRRVSWKIERSLQRADEMMVSTSTAADAVPVTTAKINAAIDKISPGLDGLSRTMDQSDEALAKVMKALTQLEGLNEESLRRLLREEGVLVRLKPQRKKD